VLVGVPVLDQVVQGCVPVQGRVGLTQPGRQRPAVGDRLQDRAQQRRQPGKHLPPVLPVREPPQRVGPLAVLGHPQGRPLAEGFPYP